MKRYKNPISSVWNRLVKRPLIEDEEIRKVVSEILENIKKNGDKALFQYTSLFDDATLNTLEVSAKEIEQSVTQTPQPLKDAIEVAYKNISGFHRSQRVNEAVVETSPGVRCWRNSIPIERVGLYIPGGSAPLFSTILMLGIPAIIAGCKEIVLCTPPNKNGTLDPAILYTAKRVGISKIYKVGGAQAIAAMAYGTESIPSVYKIFGPGNQFVTKAKELVQQNGIAIDMPAGPSEVLVIADSTCNPSFVAADLLSQAEHGVDSQVMLLSNNVKVIDACFVEIKKQIEPMPRKKTALKALENSKAILFKDISTCIDFSNLYAPEHLILASENAQKFVSKVYNAGSVFIGNYSCESAGDYASGTNHTLPTNGFAKNHSGVSLDSFLKKITYQELSKKGIQNIGEAIEIMAEAEALYAHKNAVTIRLKEIQNG